MFNWRVFYAGTMEALLAVLNDLERRNWRAEYIWRPGENPANQNQWTVLATGLLADWDRQPAQAAANQPRAVAQEEAEPAEFDEDED